MALTCWSPCRHLQLGTGCSSTHGVVGAVVSTGFRVWQMYFFRLTKHSLTLPFQNNGVRAGYHATRQQPRAAPRAKLWFARGSLHGAASGTCHRAAWWRDDPQDQNMHLFSTLIVDDDHDHDHDELRCDPAPNVMHISRLEALSHFLLLTPYPEEARREAVFLCVFLSHF